LANKKQALSAEQQEELMGILRARFEKHLNRHEGLEWVNVKQKLEAAADKLWSLHEMERTGGEPDVVGYDEAAGEFVYMDCSAESPGGRRSICYDHGALNARKQNKPENSALGMAADMGIEILTEEQFRQLQKLGKFDAKTSSWLETPPEIRKLGGAIFGDFRYGQVFIYHNGADSYYGARGFRGSLRI
jgi:hypothetical protein